MEEYSYHEAANLFPLDDENLDALAEDIRANGLKHPIELIDGEIIDGRRRSMACRMAAVEPQYVTVTPDDPIAYAMSLNLYRRHLTPSQRSMVAARARALYDKKAKERMQEGRSRGGKARHGSLVENLPPSCIEKARDAAGKAVGVSGKSVDYASRVLEKGEPELIKAVDEGRMAVSTAAILATEPPEVQREEATKPKRNRTYTSVTKPLAPNTTEEEEPKDEPTRTQANKSRGMGVRLANEAIDCLKRIPKNDALRKRGFQIVTDWIRHNK